MTINKTDSGYIFPNIPRQWQREERNFALELRDLFDVLFQRTKGLSSDPDKLSYERISKKPKISGHELRSGNNTLHEIGIDTATTNRNGLMTADMVTKLNGIEANATNTPDNRPEVDYLSMMTQIPIPTDTSNKVTKVTGYYPSKWNIQMVWDAVDKSWISAQDYENITGNPFPPFRPT